MNLSNDVDQSEPERYTEKDPEAGQVEHQGTAPFSHADVSEIEKRVVRKLDWHVVPLVLVLYLLAFLDRSNIGNARIAGLVEDLELSAGQYDWLLTAFYISYIIFEFQAFMWKVVPPHIWAAFTVLGWGLVSTLQSATHNFSGMFALRFLMGVSEAGYGPGIPYLLSFFYLRRELGLRIGFFLAAAPIANTFAGALAYGITSGHSKLANWRLLFLVEGLPTIVMAPVAFFFLPDSPEKARFLTEDEKRVAKARGVRQVGQEERSGGLVGKDIFGALLDPKAWLTALMYFSCNVSFSSLPVFLPTIINEMGFTKVHAQGLTAPPFFVSAILTIVTTWIADRTQQRGFMILPLTIIGGVGYVILATAKSVGPRYFGCFLAAAGIFPAIANILPWVLNNQGSDTRRGASIMLLNVIGQCGPLLGTRLYPTSEGPYYVKGQAVCAAFMFFTSILVIALRTLLQWENKKLDRTYGTLDEQRSRSVVSVEANTKTEGEGVENYGPMYRYVL